jgi:isopentenyldiphosphate isomerase
VVAKVRERLSVSKQAVQKFERFNLTRLKDVEVKEHYLFTPWYRIFFEKLVVTRLIKE